MIVDREAWPPPKAHGRLPEQSNRAARATHAQVALLRLTARRLSLQPVFVADAPLCAELFDVRGRHVGTWGRS
jgi:hypothetical protein